MIELKKNVMEKFLFCCQEKEEACQRLARETEKLVHGNFRDVQETQQKITLLLTNLQLFKERLEDRRKLLTDTLSFYKKNIRVNDSISYVWFFLKL